MTWDAHDGITLQDVSASVLIISDSLFSGLRDISEDESGASAIDLLSNFGFESINLDYYPDEFAAIKSKINQDVAEKNGLILLIGGTGISPRDVTTDAVKEIIKKELPGFGETFRQKSYESIGDKAMLSRAIAGIKDKSLIIALPGSPNAVNLGIDIVEKIIYHVMELLKG